MKIAFFGTYFYNFQEIVNNAARIYESHNFYFFTDKKSYTHLFNNVICSSVDLSYKNYEYDFSDEELVNFFQCDYDRLSEFNIKKPNIIELKKAANLIIYSFKNWYSLVQPDTLVCEGKNNFFNRLIINYCEKMDIDYFGFMGGRIEETVYISKSGNTLFNKDFGKQVSHDLSHLKPEHYNLRNIFNKIKNFKKTSLFIDFLIIYKSWRIIFKEDRLLPYTGKRFELIIKIRILYLKKRLLDKIFNFLNITGNKKVSNYLIYPEHFRPEAATSDIDVKYVNDLNNCKYLMKHISRLIIFRFHPVYFTKRPIKQLIKILKLFKGSLSMPNESLIELIKNSAGAITISSTVAIDCIRHGKPVIVLGNPEFLDSKVISKNLLIIRNYDSLSDIERYIKDYKIIDQKVLDLELQKLYHPYHMDSGEWIKVIIKNLGK